MPYLPRVARRLHHSRDLGEPFDFLTWFEFAPSLSAGAVAGLSADQLATASGINQAIRQLGSVLGVALAVVLLGGLDERAHFARSYLLIVFSGVVTAIGGATFSRAQAPKSSK